MANVFNKMKDKASTLSRRSTKSRVIRFIILFALTIWSFMIMFMMDATNYLRPEFLGGWDFHAFENMPYNGGLRIPDYSCNILSDFLYNSCGLEAMDVTYTAWLVLLGIFVALWAWFFYDIYAPKVRAKFDLDNRERSDYKKRNRMYRLLIALCVLLVFLLFVTIYVAISSKKNYLGMNGKIFLNLLKTLVISLFTMIWFPLIIFIGWVIIMAILWLCGFLGRQIAKRIVSDRDVQEVLDIARANSQSPVKVNETGEGGTGGENGGNGSGKPDEIAVDLTVAKVFPSLNRIDNKYADEDAKPVLEDVDVTLEELVKRFRAYLCHRKYYFEEKTLRQFIASLSVSRLMILEGLSGTGKSTLPRVFSEFIGNKVFYAPVQATWRDRTDITGYYSDFTKEYKETDFLKRLYEAGYRTNEINMMVLDEMNISRIEYYFADFLSILEYPQEDWLIKIMQIKDGQEEPVNFVDGNIRIPYNTWFIGTANTDDSTFTITDKVYDRAMVIDFLRLNDPFELDYNDEEIHISSDQLLQMFKEAQENEEYRLNENDKEQFRQLCNFVLDTFNVTFGNRIMNQIENFVPVYVAMGGSKTEAIDFVFSRKVMRKLQGKYDEYVKDGLNKMVRFITSVYGKEGLPSTEEAIVELRKKLI